MATTVDFRSTIEIVDACEPRVPVVVASPHSGRAYSTHFLSLSQLDPLTLRKSEDGFVDEIFCDAPACGAPMLKALFPRAFLDTNREAFELDPDMFDDMLPSYVNTRSPRVNAGLGTIARVVAHGQEIYNRKLHFSEALDRINHFYHPYHTALLGLIHETRERFGFCVLVDCHSMPSTMPASMMRSAGRAPTDFVLGDAHGTSCNPLVMDTAERWLTRLGYSVTRNAPYAGGYTTRHYGRPDAGVHAIQIEINRGLYMDEDAITRKPYLTTLAEQMTELVSVLAALDQAALRGIRR